MSVTDPRLRLRWLQVAWWAAVGWSIWWTWRLWSSSDRLAVGVALLLIFWAVPILPLGVLTSIWIRRDAPRASRIGFWVALFSWLILVALPTQLPAGARPAGIGPNGPVWLMRDRFVIWGATLYPFVLASLSLWTLSHVGRRMASSKKKVAGGLSDPVQR